MEKEIKKNVADDESTSSTHAAASRIRIIKFIHAPCESAWPYDRTSSWSPTNSHLQHSTVLCSLGSNWKRVQNRWIPWSESGSIYHPGRNNAVFATGIWFVSQKLGRRITHRLFKYINFRYSVKKSQFLAILFWENINFERILEKFYFKKIKLMTTKSKLTKGLIINFIYNFYVFVNPSLKSF